MLQQHLHHHPATSCEVITRHSLLCLQAGWKSWGVQATEAPATSWLLLAAASLFVFRAATAGDTDSLNHTYV